VVVPCPASRLRRLLDGHLLRLRRLSQSPPRPASAPQRSSWK
jgi:hypothetical protein